MQKRTKYKLSFSRAKNALGKTLQSPKQFETYFICKAIHVYSQTFKNRISKCDFSVDTITESDVNEMEANFNWIYQLLTGKAAW